MPFSGELVHGAFLHWLRNVAPDVGTWIHEGQKRRFFTCSSLHLDRAGQGIRKAERENIHLPLDPQKTYPIRLTLLLGSLFPLFHEALTRFSVPGAGMEKPAFIQLGKRFFQLEDVTLSNDDHSSWTGYTSLTTLVEQVQQRRLGREVELTLEFDSLTSFSRGNSKTGYGLHQSMLPLPQFVFQNLVKRWEDIAPPELIGIIQRERIEQYLAEDGIIIIDYDLHAHHIHLTTHRQRGFIGSCTYQLRGRDEETGPEAPLTLRQQVLLLAELAFYTGIGYKTAMGLGQSRIQI